MLMLRSHTTDLSLLKTVYDGETCYASTKRFKVTDQQN